MSQLPDQTSQTLLPVTPANPDETDTAATPFEVRNPDAFAWLTATEIPASKPEQA